jgi:hypothetical protein
MKKLLFIIMILTVSSCMVSQKTFDEKCCAFETEIQDLKKQASSLELKEQLMKQVVIDLYNVVDSLKVKNDTIK